MEVARASERDARLSREIRRLGRERCEHRRRVRRRTRVVRGVTTASLLIGGLVACFQLQSPVPFFGAVALTLSLIFLHGCWNALVALAPGRFRSREETLLRQELNSLGPEERKALLRDLLTAEEQDTPAIVAPFLRELSPRGEVVPSLPQPGRGSEPSAS